MKTIKCGIKAFDIHELLCHFVAQRGGFYAAAGLDVRLVDTTFTPDDRLPGANYFQVACGAAAFSQNVSFKVYLAAVTKPMFWLYGSAGTESVEQLAGKCIATYPPLAPPYWFNRITLRNHGLDPDNDVELKPARDDAIRLGLLREGAVDAALISSAISPVTIQGQGLNVLSLVGDEIRFVTSGIATTEKIAQDDPDWVENLVGAYRQSLAAIHDSAPEIHSILVDVMDISQEVAEKTYDLVVPCYTRDGHIELGTLQAALDTLDAERGSEAAIDAGELYDFRLVG
ncbi:MAG: ABC transporter substrate-binding protein [Gammaproteobacteria bacterium]|nr:ABC transporter substrate-binding protein [Gammaproteobacteria bacterium]